MNVKVCECHHDFPTKQAKAQRTSTYLFRHVVIYLSPVLSIFLLFLVHSDSVFQSALTCFLIEPTGELSSLTEQSRCEPWYTTFQSIREFRGFSLSYCLVFVLGGFDVFFLFVFFLQTINLFFFYYLIQYFFSRRKLGKNGHVNDEKHSKDKISRDLDRYY